MNNDNQFDELLHEALREYRDAEPLAGLEDRVLQRLQVQPAERRGTWWIWGAIAACVALVSIGVWVGTTPHLPTEGKYGAPVEVENRRTPHLPTEGKYGPPASTTPHLPTDGKYGPPAHVTVAQGAQAISAPRPQQFPTPVPLTESERAFLAASARQAAALDDHPDQALSIAEIAIKPLAKEDQISGENQ